MTDTLSHEIASALRVKPDCFQCAVQKDILRRALAALQQQGWRDIASAPKDGSRVLIWAESPATGHRSVHLAWWAIPYEDAPNDRGWWETGLYGTSHPVVPQFTKGWQPLPPLPASASEGDTTR